MHEQMVSLVVTVSLVVMVSLVLKGGGIRGPFVDVTGHKTVTAKAFQLGLAGGFKEGVPAMGTVATSTSAIFAEAPMQAQNADRVTGTISSPQAPKQPPSETRPQPGMERGATVPIRNRVIVPTLPTPVKPQILDTFLKGYDSGERKYLVEGFRSGFQIAFQGEARNCSGKNLKSAIDNPHVVEAKLNKELEAERIAGPFKAPPFGSFHVSPLGIVPKKEEGQFRVIHHLSFPEGASVNDGIPKVMTTVRYTSIQEAVEAIVSIKGNCFLAKTDIESAFRIVPINPKHYALLGMRWGDNFYFDRCLPMGLSQSCSIFEKVSSALRWIAIKHTPDVLVFKVLDDFLFVSDSAQRCKKGLAKFLQICSLIGIPIAHHKTVGPARVLPFLGITLDTVKQEARLPMDKVEKCRLEIESLLSRKRAKLRELQSVLGLLNFACSVILPGRAFLRRMHDLTIGIRKPYHYVSLSKETKEDLRLWRHFLHNFNGKSFFHSKNVLSSDRLLFQTDASGKIGYGAIVGSFWFKGMWPEAWKQYHVTVLEMYPIWAALEIWGPALANKSVEFCTDNEALVSVINQQTCRNKQVMFLVRKLVLRCLQLNICFSASWIAGKRNEAADALSRNKIDRFFQVVPWAKTNPSTVPEHIRPENLKGMPKNS